MDKERRKEIIKELQKRRESGTTQPFGTPTSVPPRRVDALNNPAVKPDRVNNLSNGVR